VYFLNVTFTSLKAFFFIFAPIIIVASIPCVFADSSSPRLAAYYNLHLAICGDKVYVWNDDDAPQATKSGIKQVGVGRNNRYALTTDGKLLTWVNNHQDATQLMENVGAFYAGRSGVFVISTDGSLWKVNTSSLFGFGEALSEKPVFIADSILTAAIGDSADYYVTQQGALMVQGLAHRGQYGDGKLTATDNFVQTASGVVQVVANTGHALILKNDGSVWGTGGNIYGPLGKHGYGDKAIAWGPVMDEVNAIATGSSHTLAIRADRSLWIWGRNEGLAPKKIMSDVDAVAAGSRSSIAISKNALWQWHTGSKPRRIMDCL
jgi:alpha-tubulin suppressor-like RCC1 family protein